MRRGTTLVVVGLAGIVACTGESASPPSGGPSESAATAGATAGSARNNPFSGAWMDVTEDAIGETGDWTNKVELADIDSDGLVDLLFANGGDYFEPGEPVLSGAFANQGDGTFVDVSDEVFGSLPLLTRAIKVRDINSDGNADIFLATTYQTQSYLLLGADDGSFADVTATNLPAVPLSAGDVEIGDVDGDGDLDIAIADWGSGSPMGNQGGRVQLWLNDGTGVFIDATAERTPATLVGFSWDLELVDVDNDWDLDVAVSCKTCPTSLLYANDGTGTFTDVTAGRMPGFTNNYEFAPIDLDSDGFLDLVTINDGRQTLSGLPEHVFRNDGTGTFIDVTEQWWPADANPGYDDNVVVGLDIESDGDADFLVGSLDGPDRLLLNDGTGALTLIDDVFDAPLSAGTLGLAIADLNGDHRPDVVEGQGEVTEPERVYLATEAVPADAAAPHVRAELAGTTVLARVHDNRTPNMPHDWRSVTGRWQGGETPMTWYGENLFRATVTRGRRGRCGVRRRRRRQRNVHVLIARPDSA